MLTWITILLALSTVAGVVCVALGFRGRRLDQNPICRRCGFDLQGRFPWNQPTRPTCPDCGEPLLTHKSVRAGARARHTRLLACGLMLCFPGLVLLLAVAADTFASKATATIKTTSMISSQVAGNVKGSTNLRVLTGRIATGNVQTVDLQPAIERALTLQADRSIDLDPQWLDLLETARRRGLLSPAQVQRYLRGAFDCRLLARSTNPHARVTFAMQMLADRLAPLPTSPPAPALFVTLNYRDGSLAKQPLHSEGEGTPFTTLEVSGTLAPNLLLESLDSARHNAERTERTELATSWVVEVHSGAANGPLVAEWTHEARTPVEVAYPQRNDFTAIKDLTNQARIERQLDIRSVTLDRDDAGGCWASVSIQPSTLAPDVVATLRLTTPDGQAYDSLSTITITPSDPRWALLTASDAARSPWKFRVPLNGTPAGAKATVELVPQAGIARTSTLASSVWTGEPLRFEGVEVKWLEHEQPAGTEGQP